MLEQAIAAFEQEARDILAMLEEQLLQLETDADPALIDAIFRGLHTVKGSGAMFGYTALARFTHHFENAYERVRSGELAIDRALIDLSLAAADRMGALLALGGDGPDAEAMLAAPETERLIAQIRALSGAGAAAAPHAPPAAPQPSAEVETAPQAWHIRFRPHPGALRNGMRPDLLFRELEELGALQVSVDVSDLPSLDLLEPDRAYLAYRLDLETAAGREAIEDVFLFADDADLEIEPAATAAAPEAGPRAAPVAQRPRQDARAPAAAPRPASQATDTLRVDATRLDGLMDSIGELVIAQARLDAAAARLGDGTLGSVAEEVARLVTGLRDATLSIRMLPIETVFGKFRRVVRDLSGSLGKDVRLVTGGGETEVDKTVIDRLGDPLVHMIRNSVDHGIETAADRAAAGKPAEATIRLDARQEGGEVLITIADDGRGLNTSAIRARAVDRGLIDAETELSEAALHQLIFEPGFSTAQTVSDVSGRGVGMDAVRSTVDGLGGAVEVASTPGAGTRITLRLPVTMAIVDGLRLRLGASIFVVPLSAVEECVEMPAADDARESGRSMLQIREHLVPYLRLDRLFGLPADRRARRRVVVVRVDGRRIGLVVDDILGQGQTVIKSLSPYHRDIPGLGGATILGDGRVALILDVGALVRRSETLAEREAA